MIRDYFHQLSDAVGGMLQGKEVYTLNFAAEQSDFVRFNKSQVRQAGAVTQRTVSIDLIEGQKHAEGSLCLAGDLELDRPRVEALLASLREQRAVLPEDPYLLYATEVHSTESEGQDELPSQADAVDQIQAAGAGRDLVGIYAAGGIQRGFANSLGQRNWFSTNNFNLDWSFYHTADKAVKEGYAGFRWDPAAFQKKVDTAGQKLDAVKRKAKRIERGNYRVYLSPVALNEIVGMLCWGGFGLEAHKTKQTPLLKMIEEGRKLDPRVTIRENTKEGVAPGFQDAGYLKPDHVDLIVAGAYKDCLISPRSAKEYGVETNGAGAGESPSSIDVAGGEIAHDGVLGTLDTGVYVGNLWYLNYSDRANCRTTGMTRFATFWVEGGEIQAPIDVMRFDETVYRVLGENLVGLTAEREFILDAGTYSQRATSSQRLPGAVVDAFAFTL